EVLGRRHLRCLDAHGDAAQLAGDGRLDLHADEVVLLVDLAAPVLVGGAEPALADDGDEHVARLDGVGDDFGEVEAGRDVVDVDEHAVRTKATHQVGVEVAGVPGGVIAPIAQHDPYGGVRVDRRGRVV